MAMASASEPTATAAEGSARVPALPGAVGPEIAFFRVQTSVPKRAGQRYALLEFGAILICPRRLVEVAPYTTLVRPADPASAVSATSVLFNGITRDDLSRAPSFRDVADDVYDILHGRVWAGHNIKRFDWPRIREAFSEISRPPPEPKGFIDTLPLLTQRFGRRAGDMKMASLANYFDLGRQMKRSLDYVRLNLEVLKSCATVLFLEASHPEVQWTTSPVDITMPEGYNQGTSKSVEFVSHIEEMKLDATTQMDASSRGYSGFVEPDDVSPEFIKISVAPSQQFGRRTFIQHKDTPLQLCCAGLNVQFGVSAKFLDNAGWPKLSIVVEIPENISKLLEFCDDLARRSSQESGSTSEWRPLIKKYGYMNYPIVRLNIPTTISGYSAMYSTDIYQKEPSGNIQKLVFSKVDAANLDPLFVQGNMVDAVFSLELYDYQQNAGIRLIAKRLIVHFK
ncbi:protein NEN1-like [Phragmites australis]|uniref:protein NEN1-like n=1 Tax=Phragmites australis TaxID=29695 RepID=UPI002D768B52|nr:protein NEN1-like [Phragmites australis]